jgi:2-polyprenyl-3-methyl-5-hydroxy-6-metoxy-1,4-benzoquinol methylase
MQKANNLIVIKGKAGTGKTSLAKYLKDVLPNPSLIETDWVLVRAIEAGLVPVKNPNNYGKRLKHIHERLGPAAKKSILDSVRLELSFAMNNYSSVITEGHSWLLPEYEKALSGYSNVCVVERFKKPMRSKITLNGETSKVGDVEVKELSSKILEIIKEDAIKRVIPMYGWYQEFPFLSRSSSRSLQKLEALNLPKNMYGHRVLDVGCNTGFFSLECNKRGAEVVGIDSIPLIIDVANLIKDSIYFSKGVDYRLMDINNRLDGLGDFSYILVLGLIHYFENQEELIHRLLNLLKPNGTLKIEMGIRAGQNSETFVTRKGKHYPTIAKLNEMLGDYEIVPSVNQRGDRFPRSIITITK